MQTPPQLFDRDLRARRRDRAFRKAVEGGESALADAFYLHREAAEGLADRLAVVTRDFPEAAILGAADGAYARALEPLGKIGRLRQVEVAPALAAHIGAETGDIEASSLEPESLDLLVIGLELHAANDPVGALIQARRALKPDGLLLAALFGGESLSELRACLAEAESEIEGGLSPRVSPMAELRDLGALLQRAGFSLPVADSDKLTVWHKSPLHLMQELRAMGETNVMTARRRTTLRRATLARAMQLYGERFSRPDGRVRATVEIVTLTGWAPAESQPQPLRPGSAKARLADALGVEERPTGEKPGE